MSVVDCGFASWMFVDGTGKSNRNFDSGMFWFWLNHEMNELNFIREPTEKKPFQIQTDVSGER